MGGAQEPRSARTVEGVRVPEPRTGVRIRVIDASINPKRRLLLRAAATVAPALACGCTRSSDAGVRFWAMGREGEVVGELLQDFERDSGIRVRVEQLPWSAAHEKLLTAFAGDITPDLCQLGNTWLPELVAASARLELLHQPGDPHAEAAPTVELLVAHPGIEGTSHRG